MANLLPCTHDYSAVKQINPTVDLLKNLDRRHPAVLQSEGIVPADYHGKKVFRSAVETIRGEYIASNVTGRQSLVGSVLRGLKDKRQIADFQPGGRKRYDFVILFSNTPREAAALEVKGGEGNSIQVSTREAWAVEFLVWCHLDGAVSSPPSYGVYSIIFNRLTSDLIARGKHVDAVMFRDAICGTSLRPCPKYRKSVDPQAIAPDIFLFPQRISLEDDRTPPVHTLNTLRLPKMILDFYKVPPKDYQKHIWQVHVSLIHKTTSKGTTRVARKIQVRHLGKLLTEKETYV